MYIDNKIKPRASFLRVPVVLFNKYNNMYKYKYSLYIGAHNETKQVDTDTLDKVLTQYHIKGYTLAHTEGMWKGEKEKSVIVTIFSDVDHLVMCGIVELLRKKLEQWSIYVEVSDVKLYDVCK